MKRLFTAIIPPIELLKPINDWYASCKEISALPRWIPLKNLHITLKFIGDVEDTELDKIKETLAHVTGDKLSLAIQGIGAFPSMHNPKIIWAGVTEEIKPLEHLAHSIDKDLNKACGFSREKRKFSPHITLARVKKTLDPMLTKTLINAKAMEFTPTFVVDQFHLVQSHLAPEGAEYLSIADYPLGKNVSSASDRR